MVIDNIEDGLDSVMHNKSMVDAWYFDGFDPRKNIDMWTTDVFLKVALLSHEKTSFGTYTSSGMVKRNLLKCGFEVQKVKGFNKKRHMLAGTYI